MANFVFYFAYSLCEKIIKTYHWNLCVYNELYEVKNICIYSLASYVRIEMHKVKMEM